MHFNEKLRLARLSKHLTQTQLAELTNLTLRTIQNYELGYRMPKKRSTYKSLASALGISEEVLTDPSATFFLRPTEHYKNIGPGQAMIIVDELKTMWSSDEMDENEMDSVMQALQEAYWESKKRRNGITS